MWLLAQPGRRSVAPFHPQIVQGAPPCTSAAPRTASRRHTQFAATNWTPSASRTPFATDAVNRLVKRIGERAGFSFKVHVHMLRQACGYALANQGTKRGPFRIGSAIAQFS